MTEDDHAIAGAQAADGDTPDGAVGSGDGLLFGHHEKGRRVESADERRRKRLATGVAGLRVVPELHRRLAQLPAEENRLPVQFAGVVDQPNAAILELDAEGLQLRLKAIELTGVLLDASFERNQAGIGKTGHARGAEQVELHNGFVPAPVFSYHILDDPANERKRAIGLINREKLHGLNLIGSGRRHTQRHPRSSIALRSEVQRRAT